MIILTRLVERALKLRDEECDIEAFGGNSQRNLKRLDRARDKTAIAIFAVKREIAHQKEHVYSGGSGHGAAIRIP